MILVLAGDLEFLGHILGRGAHVIAVEGIHQPVLQHGVDQREIAHLLAGAQLLGMRGLGHALLAAGDHDAGIAAGDLLRRQRHGAQARAAKLVDAKGGVFDRNAGIDAGLAGRVLPRAGGENLAHDDLIHLLTLHARAGEGGLDGHRAQRMRRERGKGAVETADRGAGG